MIAPLIGSPRRPARRLEGHALDILVLVASLAGVAASLYVLVEGSRQMCLPDDDGLAALGAALGLGGVMLLGSGVLCTLTGLRTGRRGGLVAGRALLVLVVVSWPILLPVWIGLAVMSALPFLWSC